MSANTLQNLAREHFGTLTPADEKLFHSIGVGQRADYSSKDKEKDKPVNADKWGDDRVLAANRIVWLCNDKQARDLIPNNGIDVRGARIVGRLDLDNIDISFWLLFLGCVIPEGMNIRQASVKGIDFNGSQTGPIKADGIRIADSAFFRGNFKSEGEVRLLGAKIGGNLECDKSQFNNPVGGRCPHLPRSESGCPAACGGLI